ncbi:phosphopantetheine-binding protein [Micromonospora tulbaghiae]|uniref:phosphopantetheine-binding protein n=1 Tax=Micromonospora tulbaghiae TaxID=479978 RepID=UPI0033C8DA16
MRPRWPDAFDDLLRPLLPELPAGAEVPPDEPLAALGLDSLGMVGLMVELEMEFEFSFPEELVTAETFFSGRSLWSVVSGLVGAGKVG